MTQSRPSGFRRSRLVPAPTPLHRVLEIEIAYRISDWDTPLRVNPNRTAGRYNLADSPATQYFGLHPLTPWGEYLRTHDLRAPDQLPERRLRIWVIQVDLTDALTIDFENAEDYGLAAEDLVSEDHRPCQALAERFRWEPSEPRTIIVPSAALPGTSNVVVFGERVRIPFDRAPIEDVDVPASIIAERSQPPPNVATLVRYRGEDHAGLLAWQSGELFPPPDLG
jgi:RES domain-containing protein